VGEAEAEEDEEGAHRVEATRCRRQDPRARGLTCGDPMRPLVSRACTCGCTGVECPGPRTARQPGR
jgi:hypothetical protein